MRFSLASFAVLALATQTVVGDSWFGKTVYDKWHQTELERWLSDHNVPYPTPSDRKQLEDLVKKSWDENVVKPYNKWDTNQLSYYVKSRGKEVKKGAEKNKDSLVKQVQSLWSETVDTTTDSYYSVQNWIFDSWTESQLKSFLDYHSIPNPSPRTRDSLLYTVRSNYQQIATKAGETAVYPGNWLWKQWTDTDLKAWLDERGIPNPNPSTRDKLIATIRRNSKIASDKTSAQVSSLSSSAANAQQTLSDQLLNSWSDSDLKAFFDKNGIKVPQGSRRNELIALARKHAAALTGNTVASSASSVFGAATSSAGNIYPQVTNDIYAQGKVWYDWALYQIGIASAEASSSISSAASVASASASSAASVASLSASSLSSVASLSLSSVSSRASVEASKLSVAASKSAVSASKEAVKSGKDGLKAASSAAAEATRLASLSASSLSVAASKAASSASKEAIKSGKDAVSAASSAAAAATRRAKDEL